MLVQLSELQARVIGVLMEKELTTPEQYPLSLNAVTMACNQKSSRDPVMSLSESDVQNVLDELASKNMLFEHTASRVVKYKHRFCNTEFSSLKFSAQQFAVVCVLLLRGPQTPGELRTRTNRLANFSNVEEVETCLQSLSEFNSEKLVVKLAREPGKREARYAHLFCGEPEPTNNSGMLCSDEDLPSMEQHKQMPLSLAQANQRIIALETEVASLHEKISSLQEAVDILSE